MQKCTVNRKKNLKQILYSCGMWAAWYGRPQLLLSLKLVHKGLCPKVVSNLFIVIKSC